MCKSKWKKALAGRKLLLAMTAGLLAAVFTGCGDTEEEKSVSGEVSGYEATQESDEKEESLDTAALVQRLEESMEGAGNIYLKRTCGVTGNVVIESGNYPVKCDIYYDIVINGEESRGSVSKNVRRNDDGYGSSSFNKEFRVLSEGGQPVTYVRDNYSYWTKTEGDCLNAEQRIREFLECFGKLELVVTDNGYGSYTLETELSGESLRKMLMEYGGFTAEELEYPEDLSASLSMNAFSYEADYNMSFKIKCDELSGVILSSAYGVEAEGGEFSLTVEFSSRQEKSEYFSAEKPENAAEGSEGREQERSVSELLSQMMDEVYAESLKEAFQKIEETTEPVTLQARGMAVTVGIPQGLREEGTLDLDAPNRAILLMRNWEIIGSYRISHGALQVDFRLDSDSPESYLEKGRERYLYFESKNDKTNLEFRDSYTVDADMGQAQVISFFYDERDTHYIEYYAALPLENGKVLFVHVDGNDNIDVNDDTLRTILNHCAVGHEAPQISDSGDGGSQAGNVRFASIEELLQDPTFGVSFYDLADGMTASSAGFIQETTFRVDGENIVYTITLAPPPAGQAYDIEALKTSMEESFSSEQQAQAMGILAAMIKEYAAVEDPKIIWEIYTDEGVEILIKEYAPVEGGTFRLE